MTKKVKKGRPLKILQIWNDKIKQKVLQLYKEGASDIEIVVLLEINRDTFYDWLKKDGNDFKEYEKEYESLDEVERVFKDFSYTIKTGKVLSQCWWEKHGRFQLENKDFNNTLWFMNMKNRFSKDWRDKQETEHTGDFNINYLRERLGKATDREKENE